MDQLSVSVKLSVFGSHLRRSWEGVVGDRCEGCSNGSEDQLGGVCRMLESGRDL